jgi:hypothetical protein
MHGTMSCKLKQKFSPFPLFLHKSDRVIVTVSFAPGGNFFITFETMASVGGLLLGLSRHCFSWYQQLFLAEYSFLQNLHSYWLLLVAFLAGAFKIVLEQCLLEERCLSKLHFLDVT